MILLAIQSTYTTIEVALYKADEMLCLGHATISKDKTSTLLSTINTVLIDARKTITDISFCIVNKGPAPFTTLRTVIATANGLSAALNMQLIGLNGLVLLHSEYTSQTNKNIIVLNAFAGDFYFYLDNTCNGICSKEQLLILLQMHHIKTIIGNGGSLIQEFLSSDYGAEYIDTEKGSCTIHTLAVHGYQHITTFSSNKSNLNKYLSPLYFKEPVIF